MGETRVADLDVRDVVTASPDESALDVARRLAERRVGTLVVVDRARRPLGIVTDRDVMERVICDGRDPRRTRAADVMTGPVLWVRDDATLEQALAIMARIGVRRLPVIDGRERLVGLIALDDVLMAHFGEGTPVGRVLRQRPPAPDLRT
jgi:CBS domain-containing protein